MSMYSQPVGGTVSCKFCIIIHVRLWFYTGTGEAESQACCETITK